MEPKHLDDIEKIINEGIAKYKVFQAGSTLLTVK
jgi:hypothetical protein